MGVPSGRKKRGAEHAPVRSYRGLPLRGSGFSNSHNADEAAEIPGLMATPEALLAVVATSASGDPGQAMTRAIGVRWDNWVLVQPLRKDPRRTRWICHRQREVLRPARCRPGPTAYDGRARDDHNSAPHRRQ